MKYIKILLCVILLSINIGAFSQVFNFRTTMFSINEYNNYTQEWNGWSIWEYSNLLLVIDLDTDIITIYSPVIQIYKIYEFTKTFIDSDGDTHIIYRFIDQDGDYGTLKLLQRLSGSSEVYIEFSNIAWCYKVSRL